MNIKPVNIKPFSEYNILYLLTKIKGLNGLKGKNPCGCYNQYIFIIYTFFIFNELKIHLVNAYIAIHYYL